MYKNRYNDKMKQYAYMNACDCLRYGYGKTYWNKCGIDEKTADEIWKQAYKDMTKSL